MLESLKHEDLQFQELTPEEKQSRGILARLTGPIASFTKGTRNGRKYSDKLWEKAFDAPLVKEMFKNGGLPGELQHPEGRSETDPTKIAIMMPEPPKKDAKGHLVASVDILDTPCGQIAYQLGKYGFKFGISSRGEGDLIQDFSGEESVDPDTYTLNAFDLVLIPACEDARLQFNESLETKPTNNLRAILSEALKNATDVDRKIMEEALDELNIDDNWRYVETYQDNDIFFEPDSKKYIVGDNDSYAVLNSLKNAKEYIDRYGVFDESYISSAKDDEDDGIIRLEYTYDTYNDSTDTADHNLRGHINVRADSEEEAIKKAEEYLSHHDYGKYNIGDFRVTRDRYINVKLIEEQVDREETKPATSASEILKNKPQPEKKVPEQPPEVNVNVQVPEKEEELDEGLSPQEKMDAWHHGERRENIKACGNAKLIKYLSICKNSGYIEEAQIIRNELKSRNIPVTEDVEDIHREDDEPEREKWDTDFHRLDVAYNHSFKQFDDMEADAGVIRDFTDDLEAQGKEYDIYKHTSDPGCTVFFEESLVEALNWEDLNSTEQSAAETALVEIENGSTIEDAVHGAVTMYNEENTNPDYEDEDFYMEEADYQKVLDYVRGHGEMTEGAVTPKRDINLVAKPYNMTMKFGDEETPIESAVVVIPDAIKYDDGTVTDGSVACEDPNTGEVINFKTVEEAQDWIDSFGSDCLYRIDNGVLHATPKQLYESKMNEAKYTRDELFDKFGTDDLDIINAGNEEVVELAADGDGALVEQLQKILKHNKSLEEQVKKLQEKISVGYAKEIELKEELDSYKQKVTKLSEKTKEIKVLTEKLSKAENKLEESRKTAKNNASTLNESIKSKDLDNKKLEKNIANLNEAIDKKNIKIRSLNEEINKYKTEIDSKNADIEQLKEQYETGQKDLEQLKNQYSKKLEKQNQIIEKYQRVAKNSVKRYIESQAVRLGVKSDEIVNRLPKNYSFNDIDTICEDLQEYKFNMSNLPFGQYGLNENVKVTAKNISKAPVENPADEITDYDLKIAEAFL